MSHESIYNYADYAEFLKVRSGRYARQHGRSLTVQEWAQRLGYKSPQSVSMLLTKERLPSAEMIDRLAQDLALDLKERRYLDLLVQLERTKRSKRSSQNLKAVLQELESLNPGVKTRLPLDAANFAYVAEWYHLVIKQLVALPDFKEDTAWIRARLGRKVTAAEVTAALETLLKLGLIRRDASGRLQSASAVDTRPDVAAEAVKSHLEQMAERAKEAIREQDVLAREFATLTMPFDAARIKEAKAMLRDFKRRFSEAFDEDTGANAVYQLNLQFFAHTTQHEEDSRHDHP